GTAATLAGAPRVDAPAASDRTSPPGGRYRIEGELGRGGMGVVHRARDVVLDRVVALKELPPALRSTAGLAERFRTEARVLARLTHPGIVQIFDLVEDDAGMWMAMELVPGGSLDERIAGRPLPVADVLALGRRMAEAMAYAHAQGVVHRDFKPHNVLLTPDGDPKVTDFGLAKLAQGPALTQQGMVLGSPAYMSPEQASGREADARSDVYALGATFFEMVTGRPPFSGDTTSVLMQHITQPPPVPSATGAEDIPEPLERLILRMLAKGPGDRPADMHAVARELDAIASSTARDATA
ncbi:MAG: serine/threonine protein kinase, partial [Myxococcota bacterium]|nr:serine/threonine protein kinase [Myxococcota bacterium]